MSRSPLWLPAAIYRVIADPYLPDHHRNLLAATFDDFHEEHVNAIIDALIEYGAVVEENGDLRAQPYEECA